MEKACWREARKKLERSLVEICKKYPLTKKYLFVSRLALGYQLLEGISGEIPWVNVEVVTPLGMARELVEEKVLKKGQVVLEEGELEGILEEILHRMEKDGRLKYFAVLQERESLGPMLMPVIRELRMSGVSPEELGPEKFVDPLKGKELREIFQSYLAELDKNRGIDSAGVFLEAIKTLSENPQLQGLFMIPEDLEVFPLEKDFLHMLDQDRIRRLASAKMQGLKRPSGFFFGEEKGFRGKDFSLLFTQEEIQGSLSDTVINPAYGAANEVRGWLREILEAGIPIDSVQICYTSGEKYIPLLWNEARRLDIPLTLGEGLPVSYTRPGRLLLKMIDWAEKGYPGSSFYRLLLEGDLELEKSQACARLFRQAAIGWGREWYLKGLDNLGGELTGKGELKRINDLKELADQLTEIFPDPKEQDVFRLDLLGKRLLEVLPRICKIAEPLDAQALELISGRLERFMQASTRPLSSAEAYSRLRHGVLKLKAGAARSQPGALHATHYNRGQWSGRPHNIVMGMDSDRFPGRRREDPVLLDRERSRINSSLVLRREEPERKLYLMGRFLASRKDFVGFSFEGFDPGEGRAGFPASLLLQVFRKKTGRERADYTEFINSLPPLWSYTAGEKNNGLSGDEWWLKKVLLEGEIGGEDEVAEIFGGIKSGIRAENCRQKADQPLGKFEGKISPAPEDLPRLYSATRLETLATCPFKFFLESILKIKAPEEVEYDPLTWLDPLTRGSLLHDIYRDYVAQVPSGGMTWERLEEMGEKKLEEKKKLLPPPHEHVYLAERRELMQGLRVFRKMLQQQLQDFEPVYLEIPFGLGEEAVKETGSGLAEPVLIRLSGNREMGVCGRIDRIDRARDEDSFRVWDYKTGRASRYSRNQVWAGGQQIQPALYARAAEEYLKGKLNRGDIRVERAGYLFPSERGEGQEVDWSFRQKELLEILERMLDLIEGGLFPVTQQRDPCEFCDYPSICRSPSSREWIKKKLEDGAEQQLRPWKELSAYE